LVENRDPRPTWAPRVPPGLIRRLYQLDALGVYDDELIDRVGWALRARCESFVAAVEAVRGRAPCPACGTIIHHHARPDEMLLCLSCGWQSTWRAYFGTIQHRQLSGADSVLALFREFVDKFPTAREPRDRMLLIDRLIHGFHVSLRFGPTRIAGVNLIEGRVRDVVDFLDSLAYGDSSSPGLRESRAEWRQSVGSMAELWRDERLRRPRG
jgi:hypothetical protein